MWDDGHRGQPRPEPTPPRWLLAGALATLLLGPPAVALVVIAGDLSKTSSDAYGACETIAANDRALVDREVFAALPARTVRDPRWRSSFDADCEFGATEVSVSWDRGKSPAIAKVLQAAGWHRTEATAGEVALSRSFDGREVLVALRPEGLRVYVPSGGVD